MNIAKNLFVFISVSFLLFDIRLFAKNSPNPMPKNRRFSQFCDIWVRLSKLQRLTSQMYRRSGVWGHLYSRVFVSYFMLLNILLRLLILVFVFWHRQK